MNLSGNAVTLFTAEVGVEFRLIAVDWINDEIFSVEVESSTYRVSLSLSL